MWWRIRFCYWVSVLNLNEAYDTYLKKLPCSVWEWSKLHMSGVDPRSAVIDAMSNLISAVRHRGFSHHSHKEERG